MASSSSHLLLLTIFPFFLLLTVTSNSYQHFHLQDVKYPQSQAPVAVTAPAPAPAASPPVEPYTAPPPHVATPAPYHPPVVKQDCVGLCEARCGLHSRKRVCVRACSTCCERCKCVPPGTFGNRELCGVCWTDMRTHDNRYKCP